MTYRVAKNCLQTMSRHKLRTFFMTLGSLIGVTALTLVISVGQAAERKILKTVGELFGDSSIVILDGSGKTMINYRGPASRLKPDDVDAISKQTAGIKSWEPQQVLSANLRRGSATHAAQVLGETERYQEVWNRTASRGEFFESAAVAGSGRVAVIGETVVKELFGDDDPIGADILIGSVPFRVVGILEPLGTDAHGMDRDNEVIVPITTLMRRLTNQDTIAAAKLVLDDPALIENATKQVRQTLRERHSIPAGQPDDFTIITATEVRNMVGQVQRVLFLYLPLVAVISLIAGGIVSATLMVVSVQERVAEIGLRQAIGARPKDIRMQFIVETAVATLAGGTVGVVLGSIAAQVAAAHLHLGDVTPWAAALVGLVASSVVGLGAGVIPATRAAQLHPVEALR